MTSDPAWRPLGQCDVSIGIVIPVWTVLNIQGSIDLHAHFTHKDGKPERNKKALNPIFYAPNSTTDKAKIMKFEQ